MQAGKAALVAEESAVSAANLARAARTQAALGAAMIAAQSYNQVRAVKLKTLRSLMEVHDLGVLFKLQYLPYS